MVNARVHDRVEPASENDIGGLLAIGQHCGLSSWSEQGYRDELRRPDAVILKVAGPDQEPAGFIAGRIIGGSGNEEAEAEIYNIGVVPNMRRKGLATSLLKGFTAVCAKMGVRSVFLEVRRTNRNAIEFYRRNGFREIRIRPSFYRDPVEDALVMRLTVKPAGDARPVRVKA